MFLAFFLPVSSTLILGHKGKNELAALGLGISICNVTGNFLVIGLASATETLCSQAYGAGHFRRFGIVIQRSLIMIFLSILPTCALWINLDRALLFFGQDQTIAILASDYGISFIPGLLCVTVYQVLTKFLACQGIVHPTIYGSFLAFLVNGVFCYLFVFVFNLGIRGAAFALDLAYFSFCVFMLVFIYVKKVHHKTWHGWSRECLFQWKEFLYLAIPAALMVLLEWINYELAIIVIGIIGSVEQASLVVSMYIAGLMYNLSYGIGIGTSVRVGTFLGAGHPQLAKVTLKAGFLVTVAFSVSFGLLVTAAKDVVGYLFTSDQTVIKVVSDVMAVAVLQQIIDGFQTTCSGAVRGIGYQKYGAMINFFGYLCINIPLYLVLMFKAKLGVLGFWIGVLTGTAFQVATLSTLLHKADWTQLSKLARERAGIAKDTDQVVCEGENAKDPNVYGATEVSFKGRNHMAGSKEDSDVTTSYFIKQEAGGLSSQELQRSGTTERRVSSHEADESEVFFTHRQATPHSKLEIFAKVSVVFLLFSVLIVSLVFRITHS